MLGQLNALGYDVQWHCISARAVGASHIRDRLWVIAHSNSKGKLQSERCLEELRRRLGDCPRWPAEPDVARVVYGLSGGMDRTLALGNAVVPRIPQIIAEAIKECIMSEHAHGADRGEQK